MPSSELTKTNVTSAPVASQPTASFDQQLADIKSQAAKIVAASQKIDPNIKISTANAEMIGMPKVNIPTTMPTNSRPTALDAVGATPIPKTSQDIARETILSQVPQADRSTISSILDISTGYQTEQGKQLENTANSILTQQLSNITATRDKALESSQMKDAQKIPELQAELTSIRSEADVLDARRNAAIQAESNRQGVSTSAMQGNIQSIERDFSLEKANLAIRELASVGKINAATQLIDTKLNLKYGDLEAQTALLTSQLNAISPFLNREDQKTAEARLQLNSIVTNKIADARANDKALEEFKLQSYLFAQQNGATPATLSQIMSSTSRGDVASVGGTFIQDPVTRSNLYTQSLQQQKLKKELAQTATNKAPELQNFGTSASPNWKQFNQATKTWEDVPGAAKTPTGNALGNAIAENKVDNINNIINSSALGSVVGPNSLSRTEPGLWGVAKRFFSGFLTGATTIGVATLPTGIASLPAAIIGGLTTGVVNATRGTMSELTGERQNFIGSVEQMRAELTKEKLAEAKGQDVTFGSLSDGERILISDAATKIGSWAIHQDGDVNKPVIGYNIDETNFKKEMDVINYFTKLDAILKGATPESVGAVQQSDGTVWVMNSDGTLSEIKRQ